LIPRIVSEADLLEGIRKGRNEAYDELLEICGALVIAKIKHLRVGLPDIGSEDALQHAMFRLIEKRKELRFRRVAEVVSWLQKTARNFVIDQIRRRRRYDCYCGMGVDRLQVEFEGKYNADIDIPNLLCKLTPQDFRVLYLTFFEEKNSREIAELEGMTSGQVRTKRHRILRGLRAAIALSEVKS